MRLEPTNSPRQSSIVGTRARLLARALTTACALASLGGCSDGCGGSGSSDQAVAPAPAPLAQAPAQAPVAPAAPAPESEPPSAEAAPASPDLPKPGWSKITLDEQVPICVFPSFAVHYEAKFLKDVKKLPLRADDTLVIGAFGPWCVNEACDDIPSLQCFAERSGNTITVRTHYWGMRKDGSVCKKDVCRQVTAGCETPKLEAGTYTIQHGQKSYKLKIPSTPRSPCFGKELTPPAG